MTIRGMLYCMASQVFGGATNATMASNSTTATRPANNSQSASESGLLATLPGPDACETDAGENCQPLAAKIAYDHATIDATSHTAATVPRVSIDPALNSSVTPATQIPHKVAETMKLVRQSCPRRHSAIHHPEKASKGRTTEPFLISSMVGIRFSPSVTTK